MKSYISVILISALLLSSLFFALPKTERLLPYGDKSFDLNKKEDQYWKKEFIIEIGIEQNDKENKDRIIKDAKDILYKRLRKAGVEEIQIVSHKQENLPEETEGDIKESLKVTIQTAKDIDLIRALMASNGRINFMLPIEGLEDMAIDDEIQLYLEMNYEKTEWTHENFRSIYINDLMSSQGDRAYFAIFKPNLKDRKGFSEFLQEYEGEQIGVYLGDLVRPTFVQENSSNMFAIPIAQTKDEAFIYDIIFNTGVLPASFLLTTTTDLEPTIYEIDYIQATLALLVSTIILLIFLYRRENENKEKILQLSFSLLLLFSISFTVLKIWQIPVDLFLLIPTGILITLFLKSMYTCTNESRTILLLTLATAIIMTVLGTGYIPILGKFILFAIALSFITEI
jgi:hypothetical protein